LRSRGRGGAPPIGGHRAAGARVPTAPEHPLRADPSADAKSCGHLQTKKASNKSKSNIHTKNKQTKKIMKCIFYSKKMLNTESTFASSSFSKNKTAIKFSDCTINSMIFYHWKETSQFKVYRKRDWMAKYIVASTPLSKQPPTPEGIA